MNIIFCSTPVFGAQILDSLYNANSTNNLNHKKFNIIGVITQIDRPIGRHQILTAPPVKTKALDLKLEVFQPHNKNELQEIIDNFNAKIDLIIVVAFGMIFSKYLTDKFKCINIHGSILPFYRGASPVQSSIMDGFKHFGISAIYMNEIMDGGDIIVTQKIESSEVENMLLEDIFTYMAQISSNMILKIIDNLDSIKTRSQEHEMATYCKKIKRQDGFLNLEDAKICFLKFIALHNWPNVYILLDSKKLKILSMCFIENHSINDRGKILEIDNDGFILACNKGTIKIQKVILEGKAQMQAKAFLQSRQLKIGDFLIK